MERGRQEECESTPALDLAAVRTVEVGIDLLAREPSADVGDLRSSVDLGASRSGRNRSESLDAYLSQPRAGRPGLGKGARSLGADERVGDASAALAVPPDGDAEIARTARAGTTAATRQHEQKK